VLNRLASATATNNSWGQSYGYDGFGNLTDQNVIAGSAPAYHVVYSASTNRQTGECADANGNIGGCGYYSGGSYVYDVENRVVANAGPYPGYAYSYAPGNKRVWRGNWTPDGNGGYNLTTDEVTVWSVTGQKLGAYQLAGCSYPAYSPNCDYTHSSFSAPVMVANQGGAWYYFGGKLIKNGSGYLGTDRLGSIGKFYPYGQEKPSATTNGTEKFTGYLRDSETGLDYAVNRYHQPGMGRFLTADPYQANGGGNGNPKDPGSWNRYAYTGADPINRVDVTGQDWCGDYNDLFGCLGFVAAPAGDPGFDSMVGAQIAAALAMAAVDAAKDAGEVASNLEEDPTKCPPQYQAWIAAHGADALAAGLPEANALALTSIESGWGTSRFAQQGNDFFNLETCWADGTPQPAPKYAYQVGWLTALLPSDSCGKGPHHALVATYNSSLDSFRSAAATFENLKVNDPATFAKNAVADGINAGKGPAFSQREKIFEDCLKPQ
jgi:RHS repeat-associated protein